MPENKVHDKPGKKLDKLRVIVADAIICNRLNRDSNLQDISWTAAVDELSGQYCLKLLLNWLAARSTFPAYTTGAFSGSHAALDILGSWPCLGDLYPLNTPEQILLPESAWQQAFAYLDANFTPDLELIGLLYMRLLSRRVRGEFYTPAWLVDYCLNIAWNDTTLPQTILDPACGSGNFLLGALRQARRTLTGKSLVDFAANSLYGNDTDGCAASLARLGIVLALSAEIRETQAHIEVISKLNKHIRIVDTLITSLESRRYDLVIGNPPYISFGARNQQTINQSWSRYLRLRFPASAEYKIRMHSLFQETSLQMVADNGQVILLVPDAFLGGAFYKKLRRLLSENAHIATLCELPESTFTDAVAGKWCVAHYRKCSPQTTTALEKIDLKPDGSRVVTSFSIDHKDLVSRQDKYRFQLVFRSEDLTLLRALRDCQPLGTQLRGHTGIRARNGQNSIISDKQHGGSWRRGLTSGADVHLHQVCWQHKWLNVDAPLLFAGGFNEQIISQPKILVRQTADRIIAALDTEGFYHLNNLHSFAPRNTTRASDASWLKFAAGLMNSSFWLYLYQLKTRERKRALAQIDIETIESMPLPQADLELEEDISKIVAKALNSQNRTERQQLQRMIDKHVYELYSLTATQIANIESSLQEVGYIDQASSLVTMFKP